MRQIRAPLCNLTNKSGRSVTADRTGTLWRPSYRAYSALSPAGAKPKWRRPIGHGYSNAQAKRRVTRSQTDFMHGHWFWIE